MHRFAQVVVAAEREAEVADTTADVGTRQMFFYPLCGTNEIERIAVVFRHSCGDGQNVGVEDDVFSGEGGLLR